MEQMADWGGYAVFVLTSCEFTLLRNFLMRRLGTRNRGHSKSTTHVWNIYKGRQMGDFVNGLDSFLALHFATRLMFICTYICDPMKFRNEKILFWETGKYGTHNLTLVWVSVSNDVQQVSQSCMKCSFETKIQAVIWLRKTDIECVTSYC